MSFKILVESQDGGLILATCACGNKTIQTLTGVDTPIWNFFCTSFKDQWSRCLNHPKESIHHLQIVVTSFALFRSNTQTYNFLITIEENPYANFSFCCISSQGRSFPINSCSIMHRECPVCVLSANKFWVKMT